ncbi:hypothetical protein BOX15_Mlig008695g1 [Macrostomum lignano]|uniref:Protein kinase domain-containing protein n=1 Tax=Macrostomum lignano TaxID=282301 RepID=A0A267E6M0_9PLAT|nr:hypothetical protein BOX15_Mlig008695g1 [Macrostomum lignano]
MIRQFSISFLQQLLLPCLLLLWMPSRIICSEPDVSCGEGLTTRLVQNLPPSSFSSSSVYAEFYANKAVIVDGSSDQAWCPQHQLKTNEMLEWLQIEYPEPRIMSNLLTVPRQHKSVDLGEFTKMMVIQYKRTEDEPFRNYTLRSSTNGIFHRQVMIKGNSDLKDKRNYLSLKPPLVAKVLRIYPINPDSGDVSVCLKLELFGCPTYQGVVAYSGPQGHRVPSGRADFSDHYYDGVISNGWMSGGLGQLTDYVTSKVSPGADPMDDGIAGLPYVGWNRRQFGDNRDNVELLFEFDKVRRFNSVNIDTNNDFLSWNTRLFSKAELFFSIGGERFADSPVERAVSRDSVGQFTRPISIQVGNRVGRFVKVRLYFDSTADWILLSEFSFKSEVLTNPPPAETAETSGGSGQQPRPGPETPTPLSPSDPPSLPGKIDRGERVDLPGAGGRGGQMPSRDNELMYIAIIVAILLGALALMIVIGVLCVRRGQLRKKQQDQFSQQYQQQQFLHPGQYNGSENIHLDFSNGRPAVLFGGGLSTAGGGGHLGPSASYKTLNNNDEDTMAGGEDTRSCGTDAYTYAAASFSPLIQPSGDANAYASTTLCGPQLLQQQQQQQMYLTGLGTYARPRGSVTNGMMSLQQQQQQPHHQHQQPPPPPHTLMMRQLPPSPVPPPVPRFPSDLNLQGCSGGTVYACPVTQPQRQPSPSGSAAPADGSPRQLEAALASLEVPATSVVLKERLGGGKFGEVRLAEWTPAPAADSPAPPGQPLLVAAKTLRNPGANPQAAEDFRRETRTLARLRDPNIVRVLGVVSGSDLCAVLVEYMQHGDLHQFLRSLGTGGGPEPPLSYGCLMHMAAQVASGMAYLESAQLVHRDLAARNCLLGEAFCVKICDFGMSRPIYSADYYRLDGCAGPLPVRWMAWEALLHGRFTIASDVWSFAVTVWELLTLCREQPFAGLTDEQVVDNCHHILLCDGAAQPLPCPPLCPRELYDLLCQCWQRDEGCRPRFRDIRAFLQSRDCGYTAKDASLLRRRRS